MGILFTVFHVVCCFILIFVILVQGGRGQGLSGPSFTSGNVQSLFGTKAADFLTKATSVAAICFLLTCIGLNWIETQKSKSLFAPSAQKPIDMEAVKKALEKVKAEQAASNQGIASSDAKQVVDKVVSDAKNVVDGAQTKVSESVDQAAQVNANAVSKVEDVAAKVVEAAKTEVTDAAKVASNAVNQIKADATNQAEALKADVQQAAKS